MKDLEQTYHQLILLKTFQYRDVRSELSLFSIFLLVWLERQWGNVERNTVELEGDRETVEEDIEKNKGSRME